MLRHPTLIKWRAQVLNGGPAVGERLVKDPRVRCVHFTGSITSGRLVVRVRFMCWFVR